MRSFICLPAFFYLSACVPLFVCLRSFICLPALFYLSARVLLFVCLRSFICLPAFYYLSTCVPLFVCLRSFICLSAFFYLSAYLCLILMGLGTVFSFYFVWFLVLSLCLYILLFSGLYLSNCLLWFRVCLFMCVTEYGDCHKMITVSCEAG